MPHLGRSGAWPSPLKSIFPCRRISICKVAKLTSFTEVLPPLTSSAGLDIVGISESGQKSDKLVRVDASSWSCWSVNKREETIKVKGFLDKGVTRKFQVRSNPFSYTRICWLGQTQNREHLGREQSQSWNSDLRPEVCSIQPGADNDSQC